MAEKIFADGIYLNRVNEKAPAFIVANVSIHIDKAIAFLESMRETANDKGYITLIGKEAIALDDKRLPKRYFEVDTWKPEIPN